MQEVVGAVLGAVGIQSWAGWMDSGFCGRARGPGSRVVAFPQQLQCLAPSLCDHRAGVQAPQWQLLRPRWQLSKDQQRKESCQQLPKRGKMIELFEMPKAGCYF